MSDPLRDIEKAEASADSIDDRVKYWIDELELARKREEKWQKAATRVTKLYEGEKHEDNSFNILYANTETLLPAVYSQLPRPFVDRRYKDEDKLAKYGAKALERALAAIQDNGDPEYESFNSLMEQAALGALVPGRGVTWFRYDAKLESGKPPSLDDGKGKGSDEGEAEEAEDGEQTEGRTILVPTGEKVVYETVCGEDVDTKNFRMGYARRWAKVPWIGRNHDMTKEDVELSFGAEWKEKLKFALPDKADAKDEDESNPSARSSLPVTPVWEIWNKENKQVIFFSPTFKSDVIKVVEDPLKLSGFFPCWEPLRFLVKKSKLTPTCLYTLYEEQAKELNRLTQRINRILHALKVRGFYDGTMQGLKELFNADDNTFIEAKNVAGLQQGQNLQNSVFFMPLEILIQVLKELYPAREACKATIYEITGISDLMRGDTQASETATAQTIKNRYGQQRINRMQRYMQDYVRGCLRIIGEIASNHFSLETFAEITNLDYAKPQDVEQATKLQGAIQQQLATMQQSLPPPQPGQPPAPPPQPPPQLQQQMQQAQATLAKPRWQDIIDLLRNDVARYYRIDIETNSTIASDTAEDKTDIQDCMTALSNMFESFQPAVAAGALPMPALKAMTLAIVRRFNFGREVEESVSQMPDQLPPPPPPPGAPTPEEQAAAAAAAQLETTKANNAAQASNRAEQMAVKQHQMDMEKLDRTAQIDAQKHKNAMELAAAEVPAIQAQATKAHHELELEPIKQQTALQEQDAKRRKAELDVQAAREDLSNKRETLRLVKATNEENLAHTQATNAESLSSTKATNEEGLKNAKATGEQSLSHSKAVGDEKVKQTKAKAVEKPAPAPAAEPKDDGTKDKLLLEVVKALKAPSTIEIHHADKKK